MHPHPPRPPRSSLPEALIALGGLLSFGALVWNGKIQTMNNMWFFVTGLGMIVGFYFLLLLCKAIHVFMIGGDQFWWERYAEENGEWKEKEMKKREGK